MTSNTIALKIIHWSISWLYFWLMNWQSLKRRNNISVVPTGRQCFIQNAFISFFRLSRELNISWKKKKGSKQYLVSTIAKLESLIWKFLPSVIPIFFFFLSQPEEKKMVVLSCHGGRRRERDSQVSFLNYLHARSLPSLEDKSWYDQGSGHLSQCLRMRVDGQV